MLRGGVLASACTILAAAGHAGVGGALPPLPTLIGVGGVLGAVFVILADRQRHFPQIAIGAIGSQLLFHLAFVWTCQIGRTSNPIHPAVGGGTAMDESGMSVVPDLPMATAHLSAAILLALLATRGETLLWGLVRLLGRGRVPSLHMPWSIMATGPVPVIAHQIEVPRRLQIEQAIHPLRGPPCGHRVVAGPHSHLTSSRRFEMDGSCTERFHVF